MSLLPNIVFSLILLFAVVLFTRNIQKIQRNIKLGKAADRSNAPSLRLKNMIRVALGQSKMVTRPIAGILHLIIYIGFILINIELLEILLDGILGTHRLFAAPLGELYSFLIGSFEILAFLVLISVFFFWTRRNIMRIERFLKPEMKGWPKNDANYILYFEVVLMFLFLSMNATDSILQDLDPEHYIKAGSFPISGFLVPLFSGFDMATLVTLERTFWWMHILGIFTFLNYLYFSKHLHILLAFPNTYFYNLKPKGAFTVDKNITKEIQLMMDPQAEDSATETTPDKFGASDVFDLSWIQLMNAYSCTECGRCTSACPANMTGKKLSPRKIVMNVRDRLEEVGRNIDKNKGTFQPDNKQLLDDYISREELWACTSCNACVVECPIEIDPLSIIMDMRQYLVMEQSAAPSDLNNMMSNIENNGAPWPFNNQDRMLWTQE